MGNKKILVADDDAAIVDVMQLLLQEEGYDVITTLTADNVEELTGEKPDMVLLDIWMSGVNGNEICKRIKANEATKNIPVVMFSANRDVKDIAMESGADDFIAKPFEINDLLNIVRKYAG